MGRHDIEQQNSISSIKRYVTFDTANDDFGFESTHDLLADSR